jgi:tetratricopeptide (TPR) repeat protein
MNGKINDPLAIIEECKKALLGASGLDKAKIYERMGDAYVSMEKETKASICYRYAFEGGLTSLEFMDKFTESLGQSGKTDEAEGLLKKVLGRDLSDLQKAKVYNRLAFIKYFQADYKEGMRLAEKALTLLSGQSEKDPEALRISAEANNTIGLCLWRTKMLNESLHYFLKAHGTFKELGDKDGVSEVDNNIGNIYYHLGQFNDALRYYRKANEAKERISYYNNVALIKMARGKFREAEDLFKTCIKQCMRIGRMYVIPVTQLNLADLSFEKGDLKRARGWVDTAYKSIKELDYSPKLADANYAKAKISYLEGDLDGAVAFADEAIVFSRKHHNKAMEALALQIKGLVAGARDDHAGAKMALQKCVDVLKRMELDYETARALTVLAKFLLSIGEREEAGKVAEEAKEIFERLELKYELDKLVDLGFY